MSPRRNPTNADLSTASMADIAFLLIIFFMVTTVFSANKGMEHLLSPDQEATAPEEAIFIKVTPGDRFQMDQQVYPLSETDRIYAYVASRLAVHPAKPIILTADLDASYGQMIQALNVLKMLEADLASTKPGYRLALTVATRTERARFPEEYR